jgi:hypothetical protein
MAENRDIVERDLDPRKTPAEHLGHGVEILDADFLRARRLMLAVSLFLLIAVSILAVLAQVHQTYKYESLIVHAGHLESGDMPPGLFSMYTANMAVAEDLVGLRYATMFLSFVIVLAGCLMTLTGLHAAFKLSVGGDERRSALETSSPGLVLIALGAALMAAALYRDTKVQINYAIEPSPMPRIGASQPPAGGGAQPPGSEGTSREGR